MKIPYSISINMKMALEYELNNNLLIQPKKDDTIIEYVKKRIRELEEYAASQQG